MALPWQLCDVGSRLGPFLWGGYYLSSAAKVVGIEMNSWFCELQRNVVRTNELGSVVKVGDANLCLTE